MNKHEKNTYVEPTNKFIELDENEKEQVEESAQRIFKAITDRVLNPKWTEKKTFETAVLDEIKELKAIIIFTEKERDACKRQIRK